MLIDSIDLAPITFYLGPLPVVLVPRIELWIGIDGTVTAGLVAGATASAQPRVGFGYENGSWSPTVDLSPTAAFDVPSFRDGAFGEARVWAGPRASLAAYGVAGVYGSLEAFVRADLDTTRNPWWELHAGLDANAGLFIEVFDVTLAEYEFEPARYEVSLADAGGPAPSADEQLVTWSRLYGGDGLDFGSETLATREGGFLLLGGSTSFSTSPQDALVVKLDRLGQLSWALTYDEQIAARGGYQTSDDGYVLALGNAADGANGAWVARLDANGVQQWARRLSHADDPVAIHAVGPGPGDDIIAVGAIGSGVGTDVWAARLTADGDVSWARRAGGDANDTPNAITRDGDRTVIVGRTSSFGVTNTGSFALAFDDLGGQPFLHAYDQAAGGNEIATSVDAVAGGYRIAGYDTGEAFIFSVASDGALQATSVFESGSNYHQVFSGRVLDDGGLLLAGVVGIGAAADTWLLRTTAEDSVLWSTAYGSENSEAAGAIIGFKDSAEAITATDDGGFVITSLVQRTGSSWDAWLMKVSDSGTIGFDDGSYTTDNLSGSFMSRTFDDLEPAVDAEAITLISESVALPVLRPSLTVETVATP
jgi:hypothetical protein